MTDLQKDVDIGSTISLDRVLLVGSKIDTYLGHPYIDNAAIEATVEEITQSDKVMTFKHRRRKNSKRLRGFRRDVVTLRINKIAFNPEDIMSTSRLSTSQPKIKV